ncbi:MAG: hypothetical protein A2X28_09480 [Elusimicrobia bacterium GWA2_56_46]|nr:MAG: hypothetical protein A2X28_09480 [Elusimicrobia bacterium GWA2_56_46]OGR55556.1 MAG: hypothetical protein A2X39_08490 [Elusimicrobia bacterium GWC2_56_31]HBW22042.1 hypothetical protein [Elusimicrobiota bacterium]
MSIFKSLWVVCLLFLGGCTRQSEFSVETVPEYDSLFNRENGWIGSDIASSIPINGNRTLWLFGDTWIGKIRAGKRVDATIVNNTIAIQKGNVPAKAELEFYYPVNKGKPSSFLTPSGDKGFFWLSHGGILTRKGLFLFMSRVIKLPGDDSVFGFKSMGLTMARIQNPEDSPSRWRITQRVVPWVKFSPDGTEIVFGQPLLKVGGMIYVYGLETNAKEHNRYLLLARVQEDRLEDFDAWRFYSDGKWQTDFMKASRLADHFGAEFSVSYQPALHNYVAIYTENGLSKNIMSRFAAAPEGPWSKPRIVYKCPEMDWNSHYFCYAAKGHPELSLHKDELLVSYVCNADDFWKMAADTRIYRPKFIKVKFRS